MAKFIFVMGGVVSSLGKGIACSSIGLLLKSMGYTVGIIKLDPYLNVDPGTMSPFQHGEVFVTNDGAETDLDLGHYERFLDRNLSHLSNTTSGQIYESVLRKERQGAYLGKTVQVIPHVTNEIQSIIHRIESENDIVLCEVGGTIGDIESLPFLEAVRQIRLEVGYENSMYVFLTYVPYVRAAGELKTKPTQHSTYKLREIGIQPDVLLCRSELPIDDDIRSKIALFTNVRQEQVINAYDVPIIYEIPLVFRDANLPEIICRHLKLEQRPLDISQWEDFVNSLKTEDNPVTIAICGKYVEHHDAYKSVGESLIHAAAHHHSKLTIRWVDSEKTWKEDDIRVALEGVDGILIPGGFGVRGIDGKIAIAHYARTQGIPYFGICLGMQVAVIEFAQNVCGLKNAYSTEFDETCEHPVINLMEDQRYIEMVGGTMRLGGYACKLREGSLARRIYDSEEITERHRHRYEFDNRYRETIEEHGLRISGTTPDDMLVEIVELPQHPFFIGGQFHPEFRSRPNRPHPVFREFVGAALRYHKEKPV